MRERERERERKREREGGREKAMKSDKEKRFMAQARCDELLQSINLIRG